MTQKFGEAIGLLMIAAFTVTFLALSIAITYWSITWAFGL